MVHEFFSWPNEVECSALTTTLHSWSYLVQERVKNFSFLKFLLNASFREKIKNKIVRRSRINEMKCNLIKWRCTVVEFSEPYRKWSLPGKNQRVFENFVSWLSIVYCCVLVENSITISCPGGCISTLCSRRVIENMKIIGVERVVVMARTSKLFNKRNKPLMWPIETSDEMCFLIKKLEFYKCKNDYGTN